MKDKVVLFLASLAWSCKENQDKAKPKVEEVKQETKAVPELSPIVTNLVKFANTTLTDTNKINELVNFKQIIGNGTIETIDADTYVGLHKAHMKAQETDVMPIFEIKNTNMAILMVSGKRFGGPIWATILLDKTPREIEKIEFGHKAESEDYGAPITHASFENQFVGTKIDLESNTFGLDQVGKQVLKGKQMIDGISG